ncbi:MAG: hypothetical protein ACK5TP_00920, partial [bacterium]
MTVRDVLWFKTAVLGLLKECGVPAGIVVEAKRLYDDKKATIPVVKHVLERCADSGAEGTTACRQLLTKLYYWNDLHSVAADRKDAAVPLCTNQGCKTLVPRDGLKPDYLYYALLRAVPDLKA